MSATVQTGETRQPRLKVIANGQEIPALTANVTQNSHYAADRFRVQFPLNAIQGRPLSWWSDTAPILVDVQISTDGQSFTSMVQGEIDHLQINPITGLVEADGRDLSARLIDAKTQETFLNQTSSQVATTLAQRHGLTPVVTATTTLVSRYYQQDHDKITLGDFSRSTTEWNLLTYLAQQEGFDVFVKGIELHFEPEPDPNGDSFPIIFDLTPSVATLNAITATLSRSLTLAKDVIVQVRSWRSSEGRGFTKTAKLTGSGGKSRSNDPPEIYPFVRPNMTEAQAQALANSILADISKHERLVNLRMPGELTLTPRRTVKVEGTGSSWDQVYFIAEIDREISFDEGFWMSVDLKNHSVDTEVTTP